MPHDFLNAFSKTRILCIGDAMIDRFVRGKTSRISPEAPIPVLHIEDETTTVGGAANVVRNLEALGASVTFISVIGNDRDGEQLQKRLDALSNVKSYLLVDERRTTTVKTRFIASNQQILRTDQEQVLSLTDELESDLFNLFKTTLPNHDLVILSDYAKGMFSRKGLRALIQEANRQGKPIVVDPKGRDYSLYEGATLLTPNRKELAETTHMPVQTDDEIIAAAQTILKQHAISTMIVTRDAEGMTLIEASGHVEHSPTQAREICSVSGAGDTVIATLAMGIASGLPIAKTMHLANVTAGLVVAKVGTSIVRQTELQTALHLEAQAHEQKIVSWEEAQETTQKWKQQGQRLVFTNGCFDLLHPGHISLLSQAKKKGDKLIVGLNTDTSVQRLKGPTRPVQQERARALVLAALEHVDMIVLFDSETPLELIQHLRPDALVKGADYTISQLAGAPFIQSYGGQVYLVDLVEGQSTTRLISKIGPSLGDDRSVINA